MCKMCNVIVLGFFMVLFVAIGFFSGYGYHERKVATPVDLTARHSCTSSTDEGELDEQK
jgi:hypothetical protein